MKKTKKIICQYCGGYGKIENSLRIYQKDYGYIYICENYPSCDAYVGYHIGTKKPMGWMANEELRAWRKEAHKYFDSLWKYKIKILDRQNGFRVAHKKIARYAAYNWLSNELSIEKKYCHIAMFDVELCQLTIEICEPYYEKLNKSYK
mgnify:CR=1 FL=1